VFAFWTGHFLERGAEKRRLGSAQALEEATTAMREISASAAALLVLFVAAGSASAASVKVLDYKIGTPTLGSGHTASTDDTSHVDV
jgi:hypothetical protein